ncbi:MAG: AAA family ATPase [Chloroflexi bacterium]|nr:AAA family ATPase [Chloroflexota bacterium]
MPSASPLETLRGTIERVTFYNEENGYLVARFVPEGKTLPVTIVGNLMGASVGESYTLDGIWISHPEYGRQFEIKKFALQLPATIQGLKKYLGSGLIKGIGPVTAERIVKHFRMNTLDVIEKDVGRLSQVEGVGPKRIEIIRRGWAEQKQIKQVMMFLSSHGVSTALAVKIYKEYGDGALNVVQHEPYRLARDIYGIGFLTADKIARAIGIKEDDPARIEAGVRYVLGQFSDDGHCFAPRADLIPRACEILNAPAPLVEQALVMLRAAEEIIVEPASVTPALAGGARVARSEATRQSPPPSVIARSEATKQSPIRDSEIASSRSFDSASLRSGSLLAMTPRPDDAIYLAPFYYAEVGVANRVKQIKTSAESRLQEFRATDWRAAFDWIASKSKIALTEKQQRAIQTALTEKISILTGGPGTGKTTTVRALIQLLKAKRRTFKLAAPTGRAAKRLSEATGENAQTLHRLLEFKPFEGYKFLRDRDNPLDADLIIVDELSMIDLLLMNALLKAVNAASHLLLIGDPDQLPSVGAGNVLKDLIASQTLAVVALDVIFRQAEESLIIENAYRINRGQMPEFIQTARDFFLFTETEPEQAATRVIELVKHRIPRKFGLDAVEDIQVLAPMHRGIVGVGELNRALQDALNPPMERKPEWQHGSRVFRVGDKVMQTRNNYDKQVFNGDLGRVVEIDAEEQRLAINFDGARVEYEFGEADELVHAFAMSVHKSQGSEYRAVVIPLLTQHYLLLQRNLLYTAVTRAKELVVLVGTPKAISIAVRNNKVAQRNTRLAQRLAVKSIGD